MFTIEQGEKGKKMIDQLIIGDKASFDDYGASVASRNIKQPKKKSIKETVPFSNIAYDFSAINGEVYWEERELEYVFEITASTPEKLELKKIAFANWVMNIANEKILDPFIPDYHFKGTYDDMEFADDEGIDKTTAKVTFLAYPYKISNYPRGYDFEIPAGGEISTVIVNESSHRISPTITTSGTVKIEVGGMAYTINAGMTTDERFKLAVGVNSIVLKNQTSGACTVNVAFVEEVL